jgi:hypothetical protein
MITLVHAGTRKGMTMRKRIGIIVLIAAVGALSIELGGRFSGVDVPAFVSAAVAQVNRTMSPVRVQNTARADWGGCIPSVGGC